MAAPAPSTRRRTAAERREQIVGLALEEFAGHGYHGTATEAIARRAGVSQPYLFRLFGTKKQLYLAAMRLAFARTVENFRRAARDATPEEQLASMGHAYIELLADRTLLLAQLQCYAACADPEIQVEVRREWGRLYAELQRLSGASAEELRVFLAQGMLLNVIAALDLAQIAGEEPWAAALLDAEHGDR